MNHKIGFLRQFLKPSIAQRCVHSSAFGTQAMPTFEHDTSLLAARWQTRQPSVHSRHAASGPAGLVAAGDAGAAAG
jgi:hypothetical protein